MAWRFAPALFLDVLVFWLIVRWFVFARVVLLIGWLLVLMMIVGVFATLDQHEYMWVACFAGSVWLAWAFLRRWKRHQVVGARLRPARRRPLWHAGTAGELATLCERRIGQQVDAAALATVSGEPSRYVLALAGSGVWVLEDESRIRRPALGRVVASWDRAGLVAHIEHCRRGERFEFSWPRHNVLVRGVMACGPPADLLIGHLVADELRG
jgi:hypothetical protein